MLLINYVLTLVCKINGQNIVLLFLVFFVFAYPKSTCALIWYDGHTMLDLQKFLILLS
jgi:hypothetical protein